ncbi:hypothetical protein Ahy_A09g044089 [Arachis hypogaea]|uniref:FAR1 domain-containing protein n=1 Tax=Arachis hypogaea TaxID=3818 RepID=A0A445BJJ8_ARAHY|nr:hypothetical protein Ahy_A09g044089 [Arachis hypogaea]
MVEQYQEDNDINQKEELYESEEDFGDEFTKGVYFSETDSSEDTLEAAYLAFGFYLTYSKSKGFSARKSKTFKNSIGEVYKQNFVCHRQGFKEEKYYTMENRKKEHTLETRTGCEARMWHIFYFSDEHNHDLLDTQFTAMLPTHRKMLEADIMQMMNLLKPEISTSQLFGLLASQAGRYKFVGYGPRDVYNKTARQGLQVPHDATQDKPWVNNMYEEKHMWATVYIRDARRTKKVKSALNGAIRFTGDVVSSYKVVDEGSKQPQSGVAKSSNLYVHQTNIGSGHPSKKKWQSFSVC